VESIKSGKYKKWKVQKVDSTKVESTKSGQYKSGKYNVSSADYISSVKNCNCIPYIFKEKHSHPDYLHFSSNFIPPHCKPVDAIIAHLAHPL
jgi:Zn/Cd-binding protein ZinT